MKSIEELEKHKSEIKKSLFKNLFLSLLFMAAMCALVLFLHPRIALWGTALAGIALAVFVGIFFGHRFGGDLRLYLFITDMIDFRKKEGEKIASAEEQPPGK